MIPFYYYSFIAFCDYFVIPNCFHLDVKFLIKAN